MIDGFGMTLTPPNHPSTFGENCRYVQMDKPDEDEVVGQKAPNVGQKAPPPDTSPLLSARHVELPTAFLTTARSPYQRTNSSNFAAKVQDRTAK